MSEMSIDVKYPTELKETSHPFLLYFFAKIAAVRCHHLPLLFVFTLTTERQLLSDRIRPIRTQKLVQTRVYSIQVRPLHSQDWQVPSVVLNESRCSWVSGRFLVRFASMTALAEEVRAAYLFSTWRFDCRWQPCDRVLESNPVMAHFHSLLHSGACF